MKNWQFEKIKRSPSGFIPNSILNSLQDFLKNFSRDIEIEVLEDFRLSKTQKVVTIRYLLILIFLPFVCTQIVDTIFFGPFVDFLWKNQKFDVFINSDQEKRAFEELRLYKIRYYLNLINQAHEKDLEVDDFKIEQEKFNLKIKQKAFEITEKFKKESKWSTKNIFSDIFYFVILLSLIIRSRQQMALLRLSLTKFFNNLSDAGKSFLLILITNLLVGFHSPHGWEIFLEIFLRHFGLPENRQYIYTFIAIVPVILDTILKYWIFSYLSSISPSTVATYKSMND